MRKYALVFFMVAPTLVFSQSHDSQEREEVVKVFDLLLPQFDVSEGDGLGSDLDCVFARKWEQSYHRDAEGEPAEPFQARELLTFEQALDPSEQHTKMFCNYAERNAQAQQLAQDRNKTIAVASIGFSYPDFEPDLQTAIVYYQRWSQIFLSSKRKDLPVGSNGVITFHKHEGKWSFNLVSTGTMN